MHKLSKASMSLTAIKFLKNELLFSWALLRLVIPIYLYNSQVSPTFLL